MSRTATREAIRVYEQTTRHLPMMRAYVEGEEIQSRRLDRPDKDWITVVNPGWLEEYEYRVKPSPQRLYSVKNDVGGFWGHYTTQSLAEKAMQCAKEHTDPRTKWYITTFLEENSNEPC